MLKKVSLIFFLIYLISAPSWSDGLQVLFVDGDVAFLEENEWNDDLQIGDQLADDTSVRLAEGAVLEIESGSRSLTLYSAGSYELENLLREEEEPEWEISTVLKDKMSAIFDQEHQQQVSTAVMGVRQAKVENKFDEVEWIVDEDLNPLDEAIGLIGSGEYKEAINILNTLAGYIDKEFEQEFLYYSALAQLGGGSRGKAIVLFAKVKNDPTSPYFSDLIMVKGQLLLESLAYRKALDLFKLYLNTKPEGKQIQTVYFMAALCSNALGNNADAVNYFEKAVTTGMDKEISDNARIWLDKLLEV